MNNNKLTCIIVTIIVIISLTIAIYTTEETETKNKIPKAIANVNKKVGSKIKELYFTATGTDPDGEIVSYHWDFGDKTTSTLQNPTHKYSENGEYTVTLTITDNDDATSKEEFIIHIIGEPFPRAYAACDKQISKPPLTINFKGTGEDFDGKIISYNWNFGEGNTSSEQNPTHKYTQCGTYNVNLTVTDDDGFTATDYIEIQVIENYRPHAIIEYTCRNSHRAPIKINFYANTTDPDGEIVEYKWEFADAILPKNKIIETQNATKTYWRSGIYFVKLTIYDDNGGSDTDMITIMIKKNLIKQTYDLYKIINPYLPEGNLSDLLP